MSKNFYAVLYSSRVVVMLMALIHFAGRYLYT